jgi:hypothetical protein
MWQLKSHRDPTNSCVLLIVAVLWLAMVGGGMWALAAYEQAPGRGAAGAARWPAGSRLAAPSARPVLLIFAHPRCSCTEATLDDLERLMPHCQGRMDVLVVFVRPPGMPEGWERAALWRRAAAIPGVNVASDVNGAEAVRFGAATSGQTFLFSAAGELLFKGGLTAARGHAGDNDGCDAVAAIIDGQAPATRLTPVFGCGLLGPSSPAGGGVQP